MEIQKVPVSNINLAEYNPRQDLRPGDPEYEKLKKSIAEFGYVEPLVWNKRTNTLIAGHQRLKILKENGALEVEVSVVDLPLLKEKALNLALNKIRGNWDQEKLGQLLEELKASTDISIELSGFEMPEITNILDAFHEPSQDDSFDFDSALESIKETITQPGDVIFLGRHRVLCGDSSNPEHLQKLLGNVRLGLVHTDPPYNVNYYGANRPHANKRSKDSMHWKKIQCDDMTQEEYESWLNKILTNMSTHLKGGEPIYIWNGHRQFGPMHQILTKLNFHIGCVITWAKPNFAISYADYNQQTEFCLYGWKNGESHFWNGPTNESTLWEIKRDSAKTLIHATQKPIAIAQRAIRNSSELDDIVLDLFLGSGSTLIAAESLNRICYGIEIDPKYCDALVQRYIAFVGKENVAGDLRQKYMPAEVVGDK